MANREAAAKYREAHRDRVRASDAKYRETHRNEIKERHAKYLETHRARIRACNAKYRETHREERSAYNKEYWETHQDEIRAYNTQYREAHQDEIKTYRSVYRKEHKEQKNNTAKKHRRCAKYLCKSSPAIIQQICGVCGRNFGVLRHWFNRSIDKRGHPPRFCSNECKYIGQTKTWQQKKSAYAQKIKILEDHA